MSEWCTDANVGWYDGFATCVPNTKSELDAVIKNDHIRKRYPAKQFLEKVKTNFKVISVPSRDVSR